MGYGRNTENLYYKDKLGHYWHSRQKPTYPQTQYFCPVNPQKNIIRATYSNHFQLGYITRPVPPVAPQYPNPHCFYEIKPGLNYDGSLASIQGNFSPSDSGFYKSSPEGYVISPSQPEMQYVHYYSGPPVLPALSPHPMHPIPHIAWDNPVPPVNYMPVNLPRKSVDDIPTFINSGLADQIGSSLNLKQQDSHVSRISQYNGSQETIDAWPVPANFTNGQAMYRPSANHDLSTHFGYRSTTESLETTETNSHQTETLSRICQLAYQFVESFCPQLGQQPYCIPPVKRSRHPDKSSKLLVLSMESEKRVLGSFERYFGEHKMPVFMLCHYPMSGFMKAFNAQNAERNDRTEMTGSANLVTLMLLSTLFDITLVTVSIISGNSDFAYIQRAVLKSATHMKRCKIAVNNWLNLLGLNVKVREVLAFPNLKKAMLQRIAKDKSFKQTCGSMVTLHVDDLSAPFEEEWSTPVHKHQFTDWMKSKILCQTSSVLTQDQLRLLVGALLSPRLSSVEYMKDMVSMTPISDSPNQLEVTRETTEDLSQLKLTIDGVTKTFDEFMDEYVLSYYPDVDSNSYRVPPIHFNIQSLKKPVDYLKDISVKSIDVDDTEILSEKEFMPCRTPYKWKVTKADYCKKTTEFNLDSGKTFGQKLSTQNQENDSIPPSSCEDRNSKNKQLKIADSMSQRNPAERCSSETPQVPLNEMFKGVEVLSEVMKKDTRADEGENRVISSLEYIANDPQEKPMFIICGYQYNNYLNKLREEMFSKGEANRPVRAFGQTMRAEHDCLIFHKKYGAIIVCIKAIGDNFSDWNASLEERVDSTNKILKKALKQLEREEAMIRHVTSDLCPGLKCHKLIALPNMQRDDVQGALEVDPELKKSVDQLTNGRGVDMFLCQDELSSKFTSIWDQPKEVKSRLMSWWKDVVDNLLTNKEDKVCTDNDLEKETMSPKVYRQIIGRYCGLLSTVEVWSPNNPRVEVRSASEAANVCAKRFSKLVLLPHQVEVLCSNHQRLFLYGPPGSGKTLLLILKAREWLLLNKTVIVLNVRPGCSYGYPYAYGLFEKLKKMMEHNKSLVDRNLKMYNIDSLMFQSDMLSQIFPSSCVIIDEITPSAHPIIEHLCCLQVQYIWCAGGFVEDRPITARGFHTCKMDKILRCPPIVQTLLKHTEEAVRLLKPYEQIYQSTSFQQPYRDRDVRSSNSTIQSSTFHSVSDNLPDRNDNVDSYLTSSESLNKRLMAKYSNKPKIEGITPVKSVNIESTDVKNLSWYTTSSVELGLATDGPRPHIIDHQNHSTEPKYPLDCHLCAEELARFLKSLVRDDSAQSSDQRQLPSKNKYAFKAPSIINKGKTSKPTEVMIYSNVSTIHTKPASPSPRLAPEFNSKALTWMDVLIVVQHLDPDSAFISTLSRQGIPVEVAVGQDASKIELLGLQKLYVTTYKEVCGLERTLVVFVPSEIPSQGRNQLHNLNLHDLQLSQCIQRYTEQDRTVLWFVASRSLSSLVLILP
uniref:Uncharacterized protein n=1 Tax=Biomphalaria glabrata TaxID=6526 RepID=A0A2C9LH51_BIOGL